jgi:hypothetical protein
MTPCSNGRLLSGWNCCGVIAWVLGGRPVSGSGGGSAARRYPFPGLPPACWQSPFAGGRIRISTPLSRPIWLCLRSALKDLKPSGLNTAMTCVPSLSLRKMRVARSSGGLMGLPLALDRTRVTLGVSRPNHELEEGHPPNWKFHASTTSNQEISDSVRLRFRFKSSRSPSRNCEQDLAYLLARSDAIANTPAHADSSRHYHDLGPSFAGAL